MLDGMTPSEIPENLIPIESIEQKIFVLRGFRVMLDKDLAQLYGVETRNLNKAVSRNLARFPADFMFQLTQKEFENLMFQSGTSSSRPENLKSQIATSSWGGTRKLPYAFTEHGAVMLANVLRSSVAVQAGIQVVRAFVHLRKLIATNETLALKFEILENKVDVNSADIKVLLTAIKKLLRAPEEAEREPMGFTAPRE